MSIIILFSFLCTMGNCVYRIRRATYTIKIKDITSNKQNRNILHKLKDNDKSFETLTILHGMSVGRTTDSHTFTIDDDNDDYIGWNIGWLGYYIGQSTKLKQIELHDITIVNELFYKEMSCNTFIKNIHFSFVGLLEGRVLSILRPFFKNNNSLVEIKMEYCSLDEADARQLSLAIEGCSKSLKTFDYGMNQNEAGNVVNIITALSVHPQLERLHLCGCNIGRNEYTALSTLLHCTTAQLQELILYHNNIDDEGVDMIVQAFSHENKLKELNLGTNQSITIRGWKTLSTLLEMSDSKLKALHVQDNDIGDEGALVFANALKNNSTLKTLDLTAEGSITAEGWTPFLNLLCDASSVNNTYLSNHTLENITSFPRTITSFPRTACSLLAVNRRSDDKEYVAMKKILRNYSHFNMEPFFEWEFKVLPLMIKWFARADTINKGLGLGFLYRMRLDCIYDFIREFPMLYIEPITRKEIAEYTALEEELQGGDALGREQEVRLEEIRQCKARSMSRL